MLCRVRSDTSNGKKNNRVQYTPYKRNLGPFRPRFNTTPQNDNYTWTLSSRCRIPHSEISYDGGGVICGGGIPPPSRLAAPVQRGEGGAALGAIHGSR